jgi:hypothetical protein
MSTKFDCLLSDVLGNICDFLDGHHIRELLSCGSKRLSLGIYASVRRFRFILTQLERFPFFAFNFPSVSEICIKLGEGSEDYPVLRGNRALLPSKPIVSLKKLEFGFLQSSLILAPGERLTEIFPSLTELNLSHGMYKVAKEHLEAIPSTLKKLLLKAETQLSGDVTISLSLLAKLSQNLELLSLKNFYIEQGNDESMENFHFPDTILDLSLSFVFATRIIVTKLPRYVERVEIGFHIQSGKVSDVPISVLPRSLRKLFISSMPFQLVFVPDAPFPPNLEEWNARVDFGRLLPLMSFEWPCSLRIFECPAKIFEKHPFGAPRNLTSLNFNDKVLEEEDLRNFPETLLSLTADFASLKVVSMLPTSLTSLNTCSFGESALTSDACKRLAFLQDLDCCLHNFATASCLSAFACLKKLKLYVVDEHLQSEESLLSHLTSPVMEEISIEIGALLAPSRAWPSWLSQLTHHVNLRILSLEIRKPHFTPPMTLPDYLKLLPPKLESLKLPPALLPSDQTEATEILSNPEFLDCYRHFPNTLTKLSFAHTIEIGRRKSPPSWLSDDCFAHLPHSLTELVLEDIRGLTDRFWDVIPPNIARVNVDITSIVSTDEFDRKASQYAAKFRKM